MTKEHIIYLCVSFPIIILISYLSHFIKKQKLKNIYFFIWTLITLGINYSSLYTSFFRNNGNVGLVYSNQLFPIFFCNFIMVMNFVVAIWPNKESRIFRCLATFAGYGGFFGGLVNIITIPPVFNDWTILQSTLSHTSMLIASLYLFVGKYIKINAFNFVPFLIGEGICVVVAGVTELTYYIKGLEPVNAMYLLQGPKEVPPLNGWYLALISLVGIFLFGIIYEAITKRKNPQDMWFRNKKDLDLYIKIKHEDKQAK